jgi:hypothetical protein
MRWERVALLSGLLAVAVVAAIAASSPVKRAGARPALHSPTPTATSAVPARIATGAEQRDILRTVLSNRYPGSALPPPMPRDPPRGPESLRPILLIDTSLRFCAPAPIAESLDPECALEGMDIAIASSKRMFDRSGAPEIAPAFRRALVDANRQGHAQPMPPGRPTIRLSAKELPRTFRMDFWQTFHDRHPGSAGYVQATWAVVSRDGGQALIHVEHHCGGLCGTGDLHLLRLHDGQWRIETSYMLWVS